MPLVYGKTQHSSSSGIQKNMDYIIKKPNESSKVAAAFYQRRDVQFPSITNLMNKEEGQSHPAISYIRHWRSGIGFVRLGEEVQSTAVNSWNQRKLALEMTWIRQKSHSGRYRSSFPNENCHVGTSLTGTPIKASKQEVCQDYRREGSQKLTLFRAWEQSLKLARKLLRSYPEIFKGMQVWSPLISRLESENSIHTR